MPHLSYQSKINDQAIFWLTIAQVLWAPLPLASNRTWALGLLMVISIAMWATAFIVYRQHGAFLVQRLKAFSLPIAILIAILSLATLQTIPLSTTILGALSTSAQTSWLGIRPDGIGYLSVNPSQTQLQASLGFIYASSFIFTVLTARNERRLLLTVYALIGGAVGQALLGGYLYSIDASYSFLNANITHDRMKGTFVYHNNAAAMLALCLCVGIGAFLAELERSSTSGSNRWFVKALDFVLSTKMLLRLSLVIIVIALVMTRSRMGNAGFFMAMTICLFIYAIYSPKIRKAVFIVLASLIIIDIWILGQWIGLEKVIARLEATQITRAEKAKIESQAATRNHNDFNFTRQQQEESVEERSLPVSYAPLAVNKYGWIGSGAGTFYSIFPEFRPIDSRGYYDHAHNDYVELLTDYGIVGLILFAALVSASLWQSLRAIRTRKNPVVKGLSLGTLMAITYLLLHSLVDFNLQIPSNALLATFILALGWSATRLGGLASSNRAIERS